VLKTRTAEECTRQRGSAEENGVIVVPGKKSTTLGHCGVSGIVLIGKKNKQANFTHELFGESTELLDRTDECREIITAFGFHESCYGPCMRHASTGAIVL